MRKYGVIIHILLLTMDFRSGYLTLFFFFFFFSSAPQRVILQMYFYCKQVRGTSRSYPCKSYRAGFSATQTASSGAMTPERPKGSQSRTACLVTHGLVLVDISPHLRLVLQEPHLTCALNSIPYEMKLQRSCACILRGGVGYAQERAT